MVLSKLIVKKLSFTIFHTIFLVCVIVQYIANVHEDDIQCYSEKSHHTKLSCLPNIVVFCCVDPYFIAVIRTRFGPNAFGEVTPNCTH